METAMHENKIPLILLFFFVPQQVRKGRLNKFSESVLQINCFTLILYIYYRWVG